MTFSTRYKQLNDAQRQAVDTIDGPVMVVAGPGTGKTELLGVRVANILQKTDTLPENILCLTFTDSGAAAMCERLVSIIGKDAYKVAVHTFHSFGSEVISQNREYFYNNAVFELAGDLRQHEILRSIFEELDHANPLASTMNGEYAHFRDVKKAISDLKRTSALTSDELLAILQQNEAAIEFASKVLVPIFEAKISAKTKDALAEAFTELQQLAETTEPLYETTPYIHSLASSLRIALEEAEAVHPTKPITAWKNARFERNDAKELVFKDAKRLQKLKALSFVYYEYLNRMQQQNVYDYDDMIMQVVHALEVHNDLRYNLQEKFLYIMVDEFQDTNLAQMRILHALTDNPVHEGEPNILVVGDDDQAIYGFQGADISNILSFGETYPSRELVVLTENYRSQKTILEASRAVITQGSERLELRIPQLNKQLSANRSGEGEVAIHQAPSLEDERHWLVTKVGAAIKNGTEPSEIAVLARGHRDIQALLPYFAKAGIPVRYEREDNILEQPPIVALEQLAQVVQALAAGQHNVAQALLPEVLAHPAWKIQPVDLWKLSLNAYNNRQNWMEVMETTPAFTEAHTWLVERAAEVATKPFEEILDCLIGSDHGSPYFTYYFSPEELASNPESYLAYLVGLRTIRTKLREYQPGKAITLQDFTTFIRLHRELNISLRLTGDTLASDAPAVQLLTAHKAKGLEYDIVFVHASVDSTWGQTARTPSGNITFPENLPLGTDTGSTPDERLRLFYVAMTRARKQLILSFSERNDGGKATLLADFLLSIGLDPQPIAEQTMIEELESAKLAWYEPLVTPSPDLKTVLAPTLERYKLSATALNYFIDITRGGPQHFLLNNLLHFPQAKSAAQTYGTAVHRVLQQAHTHLVATGEQKPLEDILHEFETVLSAERLSEADRTFYIQKGSQDIATFITSGEVAFLPTQKAELAFAHQDVHLGEVRLTGSLDVVDIDKSDKSISVTDYKTGHAALAWNTGADHVKVKIHKYRQQLLFYKILIENSREYSSYTMTEGCLAFIEPTKSGKTIVLKTEFSPEEVEHTRQLITAVWNHITTLSFPDISGYSDDLKGMLAFEQDLIDGLV